MPFMTESAWQYIPHEDEALIVADWPIANEQLIDETAEANMGIFMALVRDIRNIRTDYNVDPGKRISAEIKPGSYRQQLEDYGYIFGRLCNVPDVSLIANDAAAPENAASTVVNDITLYLPLEGMLDIAAECERLQKEQEKLADRIDGVEKKLANEGFVNKAPEQVVHRERERLEQLKTEQTQISEQLKTLCGDA
jgi:valyl-tRNA synthetase